MVGRRGPLRGGRAAERMNRMLSRQWRRLSGAVLFLTITLGACAVFLGGPFAGPFAGPLAGPLPPPGGIAPGGGATPGASPGATPGGVAAGPHHHWEGTPPGAQDGDTPGAPGDAAVEPPAPRLALVIDDMGWDAALFDQLLALPAPVTFAIMAGSPRAAEFAARATALGHQVLLHLPMQPAGAGKDPGPGAIQPGMTGREVDGLVAAQLARVPGASGANNHMGSLATADPVIMSAVLSALRDRGLFFLDSATTPASVARAVAAAVGEPLAINDLFVDNVRDVTATSERLRDLGHLAAQRGWAVGIGHPCPSTIAALAAVLPELHAAGIAVVPVGDLAQVPAPAGGQAAGPGASGGQAGQAAGPPAAKPGAETRLAR